MIFWLGENVWRKLSKTVISIKYSNESTKEKKKQHKRRILVVSRSFFYGQQFENVYL